MAGWFELRQNDKQKYSFVLKASNGEVILTSQTYERRDSAENGIASVKKNSPLDARYDRRTSSDGRAYFVLKAGNHQVIGTSQMYQSQAGCDNGINSVKTNGPEAPVRTDAA